MTINLIYRPKLFVTFMTGKLSKLKQDNLSLNMTDRSIELKF
jgi:hypothetical protein